MENHLKENNPIRNQPIVSELELLRKELQQEKAKHQKELAEAVLMAQEAERLRLGNELHDNVNQLLATASLYLDNLQTSKEEDSQLKVKTKEFIMMAYVEIQMLSRKLVSPTLRANSIAKSIEELVNDIRVSNQYNVLYDYDASIWVNKSLRLALYRIAQEQLKNVIQYSKAQTIRVELRMEGEDVVLIVADNGVGFDYHNAKFGIGLTNIYERVKQFGGTAEIDTAPGKGCRLMVKVPV